MKRTNFLLSDELREHFELIRLKDESLSEFIREAMRLHIVKRQREALEGLAFRAALSGDIHHGASIISNLQEE